MSAPTWSTLMKTFLKMIRSKVMQTRVVLKRKLTQSRRNSQKTFYLATIVRPSPSLKTSTWMILTLGQKIRVCQNKMRSLCTMWATRVDQCRRDSQRIVNPISSKCLPRSLLDSKIHHLSDGSPSEFRLSRPLCSVKQALAARKKINPRDKRPARARDTLAVHSCRVCNSSLSSLRKKVLESKNLWQMLTLIVSRFTSASLRRSTSVTL